MLTSLSPSLFEKIATPETFKDERMLTEYSFLGELIL